MNRMMMVLTASLAILALGQTARADLSNRDRNFMDKAAMDGAAEVRLGNLAVRKAASETVREFARSMVRDHGKANDDLKSLADSKGVTLPRGMDPEHRQLYRRLSTLSGRAFDRAYSQEMLADHEKDVRAFERMSDRADDRDLREWVRNTLPTLRNHLRMAMDMNANRGRAHRRHYND